MTNWKLWPLVLRLRILILPTVPDKLFLRANPIPADGEVSLVASRLEGLSGTQYVYACFKPEPQFCFEFIEYEVNIQKLYFGER